MRSNAGKVVNLGEQRFDRLIEENKFYIDKTNFIREWWEYGAAVTLITRPRRFGKTLNMNMMECFFSNRYSDKADLFEGLSIFTGEDSEKYRALQGTFPLIFLSFAPIKGGSIEIMKEEIKQMFANTYRKYRHIMESDKFDDNERKHFVSVNSDMSDAAAHMAVNQLCNYLKRYYGKDVIVLLDEYDTPMQEAWMAGTWDETVTFFRNFFNYTFKTNECLYRGIITGITRISKESVFSDLNNLEVVMTTSDKYETSFGFTEKEVFDALDYVGLGTEKQGVKDWYDGFTFGRYTDIYNPWSITGFIRNGGKYDTYWANTSGNGLINSLIQCGDSDVKCAMEDLLAGKPLRAKIDEQIVFNRLKGGGNAMWSLFLATGYLKVLETKPGYDGYGEFTGDNIWYTLTITNMETKQMFKKMIEGWFSGDSTGRAYNDFIRAMLEDNVPMMNAFMNKVALHTFSSFDSGNRPSAEAEPERFYHGFVLGMVVNMADKYEVRSNRESGFGRYDVMLEPRDKDGKAFIFEFKVVNPYEGEKTLEATLANALKQIEEKHYEAELISRGFAKERIRKYGFAFQGREVLIG